MGRGERQLRREGKMIKILREIAARGLELIVALLDCWLRFDDRRSRNR